MPNLLKSNSKMVTRDFFDASAISFIRWLNLAYISSLTEVVNYHNKSRVLCRYITSIFREGVLTKE